MEYSKYSLYIEIIVSKLFHNFFAKNVMKIIAKLARLNNNSVVKMGCPYCKEGKLIQIWAS